MEIALMKLLTYTFIGVVAALFIYVTALALFLYNRIQRVTVSSKKIENE